MSAENASIPINSRWHIINSEFDINNIMLILIVTYHWTYWRRLGLNFGFDIWDDWDLPNQTVAVSPPAQRHCSSATDSALGWFCFCPPDCIGTNWQTSIACCVQISVQIHPFRCRIDDATGAQSNRSHTNRVFCILVCILIWIFPHFARHAYRIWWLSWRSE